MNANPFKDDITRNTINVRPSYHKKSMLNIKTTAVENKDIEIIYEEVDDSS